MIGTILQKPVNPEQFAEVTGWVCDPTNNAVLMEYVDRYEVAARPAEEPQTASAYEEPTIEERLDDIENALIELAEIVTGGE